MRACICPICGYDLKQDEPVTIGRLSYDPRIGVMLDGKRLTMTPQCHMLLGTLMREPGKVFRHHVLAERLGYEGDRPNNLINVQMVHLRRHLRNAGQVGAIVTVHARGIYFQAADHLSAPLEQAA